MKNFNNTFNDNRNNDSRRRDFRKGSNRQSQFGSRDRERPQMHEVICSDCGKKCEVPFKPTGEKPVYCSECFSNHRESSNSNRPERKSYGRPRFQDKKMFDAICDKCGKRFELPFRPTGSKPVYCNECFGKSGGSTDKSNNVANQYKEQFDMLNIKLDKIIKALTPVIPAKEQRKEMVVKKKKKPVEKKKISKKKEKVKKPKKSVVKKKKVEKKKAKKK